MSTPLDPSERELKLERFASFEDAARHDREYWWSRTPAERLAMAERLRQIAYGYDPATARIPRPIEILERRTS
jgi:hypothetical protein